MKRINKGFLFKALSLTVVLILLILVLFIRKHPESVQLLHNDSQPINSQSGKTANSTDFWRLITSTDDQEQSETVQLTPTLSDSSNESSDEPDIDPYEEGLVDIDGYNGYEYEYKDSFERY